MTPKQGLDRDQDRKPQIWPLKMVIFSLFFAIFGLLSCKNQVYLRWTLFFAYCLYVSVFRKFDGFCPKKMLGFLTIFLTPFLMIFLALFSKNRVVKIVFDVWLPSFLTPTQIYQKPSKICPKAWYPQKWSFLTLISISTSNFTVIKAWSRY